MNVRYNQKPEDELRLRLLIVCYDVSFSGGVESVFGHIGAGVVNELESSDELNSELFQPNIMSV